MAYINAEVSGAVSEITTRNMTQSPLLRLPGELRNKIFAYAVGGHVILAKLVTLYEPNFAERLEFCLTTTVQPKPPKEPRNRGYHGSHHIYSGDSLDVFLPGNTSQRVSRIFTVGRVCRQIYTETALLQYKTNCFHFDVPAFIDLFTKQLTFDQRRAIPRYLHWGWILSPGILGRKIYLVPEILEWTDAPTFRDKLVKKARSLCLDVKENAGLWVGVFDVFDETAVLQDAFGFTIKSAADEAEESLSWARCEIFIWKIVSRTFCFRT
ncbi:hypothetical protein BKA58DRAFT_471995 [Alternaria rosae]|uniref:uncharacterized protein n=1 Tax=Alternaria rosae TaxID=1187941 RepID=UPI001E8E0EF5|nr:uncharacterized protein BKA58DRAFT_471995 [Alternaria rosae]KAH6864799.1 hypothetical protein BKA58DRAFT_471995 [Alternaria rosae]